MISGCDLQPKLEEEEEEEAGRQEAVFVAAKRLKKSPEPTSVLYNRSPSPPTSSSLGGGAAESSSSAAAGAAAEPPPISAEDWEAVISGDMAAPAAAAQDSSFLRWLVDSGDGDVFGACAEGLKAPAFEGFLPPPSQLHAALYQEPVMESLLLPQFPSAQLLAPPLPNSGAAAGGNLEPQAAVDELLEAARRADAGDTTGARGILARLNQQLPSPPPHGHPPLLRAASHLRDALLRLLTPTALPSASVAAPLDVALKLAAHKAFADASPTVQFASFTATQAFLDALGGARRVHIVDLDVGFGGHWPPLMQELAHQWHRSAAPLPPPMLRVTALVTPGSRHPLELHLTHESLSRFAAELGIAFEFNVVVFDPFNTSPPLGLSAAPGEAVAVYLPVGSGTFSPAPSALRVVKQLRPSIVVCIDHGCDRGDLPFSRHAFNVLQSCVALLESLDAAAMAPDALGRVERFVLQPRVEGLVLAEKLPPWRVLLTSAGFAPLQLSNAAEAQAECLLRRTPVKGFRVETSQSALALWWPRSELVSVSAWRC